MQYLWILLLILPNLVFANNATINKDDFCFYHQRSHKDKNELEIYNVQHFCFEKAKGFINRKTAILKEPIWNLQNKVFNKQIIYKAKGQFDKKLEFSLKNCTDTDINCEVAMLSTIYPKIKAFTLTFVYIHGSRHVLYDSLADVSYPLDDYPRISPDKKHIAVAGCDEIDGVKYQIALYNIEKSPIKPVHLLSNEEGCFSFKRWTNNNSFEVTITHENKKLETKIFTFDREKWFLQTVN